MRVAITGSGGYLADRLIGRLGNDPETSLLCASVKGRRETGSDLRAACVRWQKAPKDKKRDGFH